MIPIQILRVLSTIQQSDVPALLMGGQACVLYGAAEYSRDLDLAVLATETALPRLSRAMHALQATVIEVPPFELQFLSQVMPCTSVSLMTMRRRYAWTS